MENANTPNVKSGIPRDRIQNSDKIVLIEDLIKCSMCLEILAKPFECETCSTLFCEDCINDLIRIKLACPMKCSNFKLTKAKINTRMLNLIQLSCINTPYCTYNSEYWNMFEHESKCDYQKIKCPNYPCVFEGHFRELKSYLMNICEHIHYEYGFVSQRLM
jgi:hypothetical protein